MKQITHNPNKFVLAFYKDEDVFPTLIQFFEEQGIKAAWFTAIGAVKQADIRYLDLDKKQYLQNLIVANMEVASMTGNFGYREDGVPVIHAHGVFSGKDLIGKSGHIQSMIVSVTLEVLVEPLDGEIRRLPDEASGAFLMCRAEELPA